MAVQLEKVQAYLSALQYNHTGCQFFEVQKHLPLNRLLELAKRMAKLSLPIKCLEAVVLATYLTMPLTEVVGPREVFPKRAHSCAFYTDAPFGRPFKESQ
jgi:hypothetical protein